MMRFIHAYVEYDDFACGLFPDECPYPYPVFRIEGKRDMGHELYGQLKEEFDRKAENEANGMYFEVEFEDGKPIRYTGVCRQAEFRGIALANPCRGR